MYLTGTGRRDPPYGNPVFVGRNDNQVKIRGFRIELAAKIQGRLAEYPAVREAVVLALANDSGENSWSPMWWLIMMTSWPAACVSIWPRDCPTIYGAGRFCGGLMRVPAWAQRQAGPKGIAVADDDAYARAAYEAPQGETEAVLATIWSDLFRVERTTRNTDLFSPRAAIHSWRSGSSAKSKSGEPGAAEAFLPEPTIAALAKELAHDHHARKTGWVATLRTGATGLPIYFMGARPEEFRLAQLIRLRPPHFHG